LFKGYRLLVPADREFQNIKLADWLHSKGIGFVLRQEQGTYVQLQNSSCQRLQTFLWATIDGTDFTNYYYLYLYNFRGRQCQSMDLQKYVGRLQELKRIYRRHSPFWVI
jgi:hypothetical protein